MSEANQTFHCPHCNRRYQWKPDLSGKRVKCKCEYTLTIPASPDAPVATPTAAPAWGGSHGAPPAAEHAPAQPAHSHQHAYRPPHAAPAAVPVAAAAPPPAQLGDDLAALASAGADEYVQTHVAASRRVVTRLQLDLADIAGLKRVSAGLMIAMIAAIAWLAVAIAAGMAVVMTKLVPPGSDAVALGLVLSLIVLIFALVVFLAQFVAMIMLCFAPRDSGARGYMISAIVIPVVGVILGFGLAIGLAAAGVMQGAVAAMMLMQLTFGVGAVCYMLYHGALAKYIQKQRLGSQATYLTILVLIVMLLSMISSVCKIAGMPDGVDAVGAPLPPGSEITVKQATFLGLPAAQAVGGLFNLGSSCFGMITAIWYVFAAAAFRKGIAKAIRQATVCGHCNYDLRSAPGPLCPNCGAERTDAYVHQAMMYAQQQQPPAQPARAPAPPPGQSMRR